MKPDDDMIWEQEQIYRIVYVDMPCVPKKCTECEKCRATHMVSTCGAGPRK